MTITVVALSILLLEMSDTITFCLQWYVTLSLFCWLVADTVSVTVQWRLQADALVYEAVAAWPLFNV
jgi:hypothetical protein